MFATTISDILEQFAEVEHCLVLGDVTYGAVSRAFSADVAVFGQRLFNAASVLHASNRLLIEEGFGFKVVGLSFIHSEVAEFQKGVFRSHCSVYSRLF